MHKVQIFTLTAILVGAFVIYTGCDTLFGSDDGNGDIEYIQIKTQDDADSVAMLIEHQVDDPISVYDSTTWNSEQIDGSYLGYAIVSGSYTESDYSYGTTSYYTYDNVSIEYSNYQTQSDYPSLTGSATIDGTLSYYQSYSSGSYDGEWIFSGEVTLDPSVVEDTEYGYLYEGTVEFTFIYEEKLYYYGTVTANGSSWNVDNYY